MLPIDGIWPERPQIRLAASGRIHHPPQNDQLGSPGTIQSNGVYLSGTSGWLPHFGNQLLSFNIAIKLPSDWLAISQGEQLQNTDKTTIRWRSTKPMRQVYLIAGPLHEYRQNHDDLTAYAYLRTADQQLANNYLNATEHYIALYSDLIGRYPYRKFALIENFWESGYGMPSFTLLGSRVIRLPFILYSSFPHEILHNWWGNSVYVDATSGNWSEGLTSYLADHLLQEQRGRGREYRRDTLKKYRAYAHSGRDFPLTEFRSRHSPSSQAVGYGKSLMLWHMLRIELGDQVFRRALRELYRQRQFQATSFADIESIFSAVSGIDLQVFFQQWTERLGAPRLTADATLLANNRVRIVLEQQQVQDSYRLTLPIAFSFSSNGQTQARIERLVINDRRTIAEFTLPGKPLRVDIDPYFDLFRQLHSDETPVTIADLRGANQTTLILPGEPDAPELAAWQAFAEQWQQQAPAPVVLRYEQQLQHWPDQGAVWVLGRHNRWRQRVLADVDITRDHSDDRYSVVVVSRATSSADGAGAALQGWIGVGPLAALPALARKLPHYGKYSYLLFDGAEARNVDKGQWPVKHSPLAIELSDNVTATPAQLPPRPALVPSAH